MIIFNEKVSFSQDDLTLIVNAVESQKKFLEKFNFDFSNLDDVLLKISFSDENVLFNQDDLQSIANSIENKIRFLDTLSKSQNDLDCVLSKVNIERFNNILNKMVTWEIF